MKKFRITDLLKLDGELSVVIFLTPFKKLGKIFTINLCFCTEYSKHRNRVSAMYTRYTLISTAILSYPHPKSICECGVATWGF